MIALMFLLKSLPGFLAIWGLSHTPARRVLISKLIFLFDFGLAVLINIAAVSATATGANMIGATLIGTTFGFFACHTLWKRRILREIEEAKATKKIEPITIGTIFRSVLGIAITFVMAFGIMYFGTYFQSTIMKVIPLLMFGGIIVWIVIIFKRIKHQ